MFLRNLILRKNFVFKRTKAQIKLNFSLFVWNFEALVLGLIVILGEGVRGIRPFKNHEII